MDQGTLVNEQIDGGEKIVRRLLDENFPVQGAAWVKLNDEPRWHLYVVSSAVDALGPLAAYRQMGDALGDMDPIRTYPVGRIDPFAIRLISPGDPLAQGILDVYRRFTEPAPTWMYSWLGPVVIDQAYIYPPTLFRPKAKTEPPVPVTSS